MNDRETWRERVRDIRASRTTWWWYLSLYLKGLYVRGSWRPNRTATYGPTLLCPSVFLSRSPGLFNQRPGGPLCWVQPSFTASCHQRVRSLKLPDFLSSPSYIIVPSPTQYLPITGHRDVPLPLSLEWHVWLSSSGNSYHAVHSSLSSGASVYDCTMGFYLVPYCQPSPSTRFLPITAIGMCHFRRLWNGMFSRVEGQYTTLSPYFAHFLTVFWLKHFSPRKKIRDSGWLGIVSERDILVHHETVEKKDRKRRNEWLAER